MVALCQQHPPTSLALMENRGLTAFLGNVLLGSWQNVLGQLQTGVTQVMV